MSSSTEKDILFHRFVFNSNSNEYETKIYISYTLYLLHIHGIFILENNTNLNFHLCCSQMLRIYTNLLSIFTCYLSLSLNMLTYTLYGTQNFRYLFFASNKLLRKLLTSNYCISYTFLW